MKLFSIFQRYRPIFVQRYQWANDIEYEFGTKLRDIEIVNVVICYESWEENHSRSTKTIEKKETRYAWISSKKLSKSNVLYT